MIYGSVCSGIEAASVAWHPLGWRAAFLSEIEAFPRAVLKHHYADVPLHGDFTTIQAGEYEPIDLLVGGTPCQSFSVAGLRGGLDDERGNLALEYLRLADRLRPRWLVWENVPGVLSSNGGRDFGSILGGLVELGYGFAYRVLDAQFFGVAQRRRRMFVVGHLGDWRLAAAVLFERHSLQGHPAPRRLQGEGIAPTISARPSGGGGLGTDFDCDGGLIATPILDGAKGRTDKRGSRDGAAIGEPGDPMFTLREGSAHAIAFALRGREGGSMPEFGGEQVGALRSTSGGSSRDYVAFAENQRNEVRELGVAGALAGIRRGDAKNETLLATSAVRRLTPRECERLQGFPDDYTLIPWRKGVAADGPRYKALGNSMAVPVMAWIGQRIAMVDAIQIEARAA
jgi:DNA (cytosine-5)-methyltransferase 1